MPADMHPTHTCFDDVAEFCMRNGGIVIHGLIPHPHAWVEYEGKIWQGGVYRGKRCFYALPMAEFYRLYQPLKTTRYSPKLYLTLWKQLGHPGPWRAEYRALCTDDNKIHGAVTATGVTEVITYED
jgi:hypothetical protein